jgi:hypothetical protein
MSKEEIIEAFENLRYFESTDEIEWGRVLSEADRAIEALKEQLILSGVSKSVVCDCLIPTTTMELPHRCVLCNKGIKYESK